ncbi:MAG TPA: hypothetical protein DEP48_01605 [Persephonella sp.]|uniref:Uncharacterized protein n=1 Tax=Persephonella marina (strain DSM 14350 / EX-H1) TaxID=123214 RepID=C0QRJ1_PERMH|nr:MULTISPECIES: hypothetical protein [Persephonella]ACO04378.1 hypothetical protein PERMA_1520 [Persephonella marina EX-H1]HCB69032.1 hypothetical protein [Persephonella sp.]
MNLEDLKKTEKKEECFKCGVVAILYEDPNIEGLYFCEKCWQERIKTEEIEEWGFDEEIPYE